MNSKEHFRRLEAMYQSAPLNEFYLPVMDVSDGTAEISINIEEKYFHAAQAVHGAVYFKMLDDAAFFAVSSLEMENMVLTTSLRPI
ncbi:MAG: hypothetical protein L3J46_07505 [Kangiellaceae bacterium]|nr:hypothetical protein [Kangiellaceae bacterium]